jgi:hypothetical protein
MFEIVHDSITDQQMFESKDLKLIVALYDFETKMNWYDAESACEGLGNGWRMPSVRELWLFQKVFFDIELGNFKRDFYWSQVGGRWYHFSQPRGLEVSDSRDSLKCVRAVKSLALPEEKSEIGTKIYNLIWP